MDVFGDKETIVSGLLIKYKGLYDYGGLYRVMQKWFKDKQYLFQEDRYKDKLYTVLGNEIEPKWTGVRKINEYIKYEIGVEFHLWDAKDIEVEENGIKKTMCTGRMTITLKGVLHIDYSRIFKGKKDDLKTFLGNVLKKALHREIEWSYMGGIEDEVYDLRDVIRDFLYTQGKPG